ncbi:MAG: hypothetical protein A2X48_04940 [Lentisphaerae bacterium GWF2_49_21]|nr:MAG: hypothetical protein A2X48_04940 [Lentisphaerae bacterium GWF2_49_21]
MRTILTGLSFLLLSLNLSAAWEVKDDFSSYKAGDDASPAWDTASVSWEVQNGSFINTDSAKSFAFPSAAPIGKKVAVEATVTVESSLKADWKIAGIVIEQSENNYWHFAMVESPESMQNRHSSCHSERAEGSELLSADFCLEGREGRKAIWRDRHTPD